jgi:hypothetical protein
MLRVTRGGGSSSGSSSGSSGGSGSSSSSTGSSSGRGGAGRRLEPPHYGFVGHCFVHGESSRVGWRGLSQAWCRCGSSGSSAADGGAERPTPLVLSGPMWTGPLHDAGEIRTARRTQLLLRVVLLCRCCGLHKLALAHGLAQRWLPAATRPRCAVAVVLQHLCLPWLCWRLSGDGWGLLCRQTAPMWCGSPRTTGVCARACVCVCVACACAQLVLACILCLIAPVHQHTRVCPLRLRLCDGLWLPPTRRRMQAAAAGVAAAAAGGRVAPRAAALVPLHRHAGHAPRHHTQQVAGLACVL